jgi:hypothetical protein
LPEFCLKVGLSAYPLRAQSKQLTSNPSNFKPHHNHNTTKATTKQAPAERKLDKTMPRDKKFNKRGGGQRVDAQSADEIEERNARLAEFEEKRAARRSEEDEEDDEEADDAGGDGGDDDDKTPKTGIGGGGSAKPKKDDDKPVQQTSAADHRKNLAKLEAVRKRREEAEARRKAEQELEIAMELDRKAKIASLEEDDDDDDDDGDDGKKKKKKSGKSSIPKLSKIEIKKMKPAIMKEALKERGLEIQGNAKTLMARLIEYEENR